MASAMPNLWLIHGHRALPLLFGQYSYRMATDLEYSRIFLNVENLWNSQGILCNLREN